ncbi:TetR family transcriptional regulator [Gordonia sp. CNJ-863]|uniref:TetR family transcriptional regulator n=1 Tax=Gordonia alkanivorans CGMCC 6845 TaxID=1423140 RepID=W9DME0_9ACTN|nr:MULTISPECIES: TetR/AcrR family transcriptional regulator [Gordonia]ETA08891.1 TetR family transcriptional regulator [Gordonia alkanivorans CGMCC 6845]OLT49872.1 TetR family transcriptional regulator [Gordonia sp. CNJ-863]WJG15069.1 TetR/AcrR family transcriptional regulator [Gordonia sp. Swx-4]
MTGRGTAAAPVIGDKQTASKRTRMSPEARRDQLLEFGLEMVRDRPLEEITIDAIADAAGVSRALLFHYFASKQDYHVAIAQAQADRMLACTEPDASLGDPIAILTASMAAFVDFVSENRSAYTALIRGASSSDPAMRDVFDRTREVMVGRVLDHAPAFGVEVTPTVVLSVHGWVAFVEETTIRWLTSPTVTREDLLGLITAALPTLAGAAS